MYYVYWDRYDFVLYVKEYNSFKIMFRNCLILSFILNYISLAAIEWEEIQIWFDASNPLESTLCTKLGVKIVLHTNASGYRWGKDKRLDTLESVQTIYITKRKWISIRMRGQ